MRLPRHVNTERINFPVYIYLVALEIPSGEWESRTGFCNGNFLPRSIIVSSRRIDFFQDTSVLGEISIFIYIYIMMINLPNSNFLCILYRIMVETGNKRVLLLHRIESFEFLIS